MQVADAFGGDQFSPAPIQVPHEEEKVLPLQKPPKWIRKPVGATFAVSFIEILWRGFFFFLLMFTFLEIIF